MEMSGLLVIFLVLILSIALYYGLLVDMGTINDDYVIPVAILFLLITTGGFTGNNGFTGDYGLDYCNDKDSVTGYTAETERVVVHSKSFFACELGYIDGMVDIGWSLSAFKYNSAGLLIKPDFESGQANKIFNLESKLILDDLYMQLKVLEHWNAENIHSVINNICEIRGVGFGKVGQPFRLALSGDGKAGSIDISAQFVGKKRTISRLKMAIKWINNLDS